jgi:D-alanyl-D-alanine carboxypeptidase
VQHTLDAYRQQYNIPAISLSVSPSAAQSQVLYNCYSGTHALDNAAAIDANSRFEIASLTKATVATIILKLEAQAKLNIENPLGSLLQNKYPDWSAIKIKELLNMTGGTSDYSAGGNFGQRVIDDPGHYWAISDLTDNAYYNVLPHNTFVHGKSWFYCNTNYELAGLIIEAATGKSVKENLEEFIFKPLHMTNTIYDPTILPRNIPNMVRGYTTDQHSPFYGENILDFSTSIASSAGAAISTPEDYLKFIQALFSGRLIPDKQFKEFTSLVCKDGNNGHCTLGDSLPAGGELYGYGLGVEWTYNQYLKKWYWWHSGTHDGGYHNTYTYMPQDGFAIVIFTNITDRPSADYDHYSLVAQIYSYFHPNT